jgi:predicted metal-dependent HD superfamily phosphohydrolase
VYFVVLKTMESHLIDKARHYAKEALSDLPSVITYHTFKHTQAVVQAAEEIGNNSGLSQHDLETVLVAAWFHDTGYKDGHYQHETRASEAAREKLLKWGMDPERVKLVQQAIESTRMPQVPKNLIDKVLCDADLYHLSSPEAEEHALLLRQEMAQTRDFKFSDEEWAEFNLRFLKNHEYFTSYGQAVLELRKKKIIKQLKKKVKAPVNEKYVETLEEELKKLTKKVDKNANPERGIETMFRIASENHFSLSSMADTKANIMISINSIILSVVVTVLFRKLEEFPNLLIPTLMLVAACLVTIVFAILATRPNVSTGKFTKEDIQAHRTNLLFFGNFHGMELSNYDWGMREMMKDREYLYGSLIKDIYFNGKVLARKYQLLRWAYSSFMFGFVASIVAFIIAMLIFYYPSQLLINS